MMVMGSPSAGPRRLKASEVETDSFRGRLDARFAEQPCPALKFRSNLMKPSLRPADQTVVESLWAGTGVGCPEEGAMTSELSEFLADLGGRRQRLLELVRPDDPGALIDELTELGEQLVIAEEELRVQQEELVAAGARMETLVHEREDLRNSAAQPYVLTDRRGVVLRTNLAADRLIRRPAIRATPRPIATWFEVTDRPAVRTLISRLSSGQDDRAELRVLLKRSDHSTLPVLVAVVPTPGGDPSLPELLWRLEPGPVFGALADEPPPADQALQLVTEPEPEAPDLATPAQPALARELTMLAVALAACQSEERLLEVAVEGARRLIRHAEHAGVLLLHRHGRVEQAVPVAELDFGSILAVEVAAGEKVLGTLSLYAERPDAFDEQAAAVASLVAIQLGLSLNNLRTVHNLRAGLATRAEIGEAIGILMERRRITSQNAFQVLVLASQKNNVKLHTIAHLVAQTGQDPATIRSP